MLGASKAGLLGAASAGASEVIHQGVDRLYDFGEN
jgi:hypothetical protein